MILVFEYENGIIECNLNCCNNSMSYEMIQQLYLKNLKDKGVKALTETSGFGQALCCLFENIGKPVEIKTIREYVQSKGIKLKGGDSLQVRHLAMQFGYNMLKGGEIHPITNEKVPKSCFLLMDLDVPYHGFKPKRRKLEMTDDDWKSLLAKYENMCVNCGSKEGEPLRWNKHKITVLQKGHMDPRKPLTEDNTIPQCAMCNQQYKNKAVFNERGFVVEFNKKGFTELV
jgi:hypothetical protein